MPYQKVSISGMSTPGRQRELRPWVSAEFQVARCPHPAPFTGCQKLMLGIRTAIVCFPAPASAGRLARGLHLQNILQYASFFAMVFFKASTDLRIFLSPLKALWPLHFRHIDHMRWSGEARPSGWGKRQLVVCSHRTHHKGHRWGP